MSHKTTASVAHTIGIDTGKNTPHWIGLDDKGALVLREKIARGRVRADIHEGQEPNAPCKGRIQKRKTTLHFLKSGLQRTPEGDVGVFRPEDCARSRYSG